MKKLLILISCIIFISFFNPADASAFFKFGVQFGLSTPNDMLNDVYNTDKLKWNSDTLQNAAREGMNSGYHLGIRLRLPLDEEGSYTFVGAVGFNRFQQSKINITNPKNDSVLGTLSVIQNVIPIAVGMDAYLFKNIIGVYATGELTYNYLANTVDLPSDISIPFQYSQSPSDNRVGFGIGAGVDLDVKLVTFNLEARYNMINLIGRAENEQIKSYITLSLGIFF